MGDPTLDEMATYIKKFADIKFQMKTTNLEPSAGPTMQDYQAEAMKLYGKDKPKDLMSVAEEELIKRGEL